MTKLLWGLSTLIVRGVLIGVSIGVIVEVLLTRDEGANTLVGTYRLHSLLDCFWYRLWRL